MINLKPWKERDQTVNDVIKELRDKTKDFADGEIEFFPPPTVPGFGNSSGFELRLLDRSGNEDLNKTAEVLQKFMDDMEKSDVLQDINSSFDVNFPQYMLKVDYDMAAKKRNIGGECYEYAADLNGKSLRDKFHPLRTDV
jgi:HAE1 family hydrophobic/amphiphilic exporter-1